MALNTKFWEVVLNVILSGSSALRLPCFGCGGHSIIFKHLLSLQQVPTDALRSSLRSTQRVLERDLDKLNTSLKEAAGNSPRCTDDNHDVKREELEQVVGTELEKQNDIVKVIDGLLSKARGLKRKLDDTYNNPRTGMAPSLTRIKARIDHLQNLYSSEYSTDLTVRLFFWRYYQKFSQTRLDRHLVDFMLRSGHTQSAQSLSQVADVEMLTDAPLFSELARIEKALANHSCSEALAWCKENAAALKKAQSTLEFELRYQEFIELVKAKKFTEAISYSQKQLIPWQNTRLAEISQVMTLLAFDQGTRCPPYARLYDESRWADLLDSFRSTLFALLSIPEQPFLHLSLSVGLASLKLPACYANTSKRATTTPTEDVEMTPPLMQSRLPIGNEIGASSTTGGGGGTGNVTTTHSHLLPPSNYDPSLVPKPEQEQQATVAQKNRDCPTCDPKGLGELAKECPWSHHVNSIIVCGLTGKVVNDGDGLAVLPNGRVYSRDGLERLACKDNGRVCCPRTGQVFALDEIRRVFIS
ncbi:hypothetical protein VP01_760g7 [Puccinia sorghi]|uniref:CTLH domain-containing protein n=1 Tax=Puccinia sorghi TaxID=27349 RepID=A0A0L6UBV3_9BASI|nr:hypothetical protein VP01_760g7 [Puccinia sorghi]